MSSMQMYVTFQILAYLWRSARLWVLVPRVAEGSKTARLGHGPRWLPTVSLGD